MNTNKPMIAVSSCLMGNNVRYDGGNKHLKILDGLLKEHLSFKSFCPEAIFGIPRERISLFIEDKKIRVIGEESGQDKTDELINSSRKIIKKLPIDKISGFIVKSKSPSCGYDNAVYKIKDEEKHFYSEGVFVSEIKWEAPYIPIIQETDLSDDWKRFKFFTRVFALNRLNKLVLEGVTEKAMFEYLVYEELLLKTFNREKYESINQQLTLLLNSTVRKDNHPIKELFQKIYSYELTFTQIIFIYNEILQSIQDKIDISALVEINSIIQNSMTEGFKPYSFISALRGIVEKEEIDYLQKQTFLDPYPEELEKIKKPLESGL